MSHYRPASWYPLLPTLSLNTCHFWTKYGKENANYNQIYIWLLCSYRHCRKILCDLLLATWHSCTCTQNIEYTHAQYDLFFLPREDLVLSPPTHPHIISLSKPHFSRCVYDIYYNSYIFLIALTSIPKNSIILTSGAYPNFTFITFAYGISLSCCNAVAHLRHFRVHVVIVNVTFGRSIWCVFFHITHQSNQINKDICTI